jgi:hypothetical protein
MKTRLYLRFVLVAVVSTVMRTESVLPAADRVVTYPAPAGEPLSRDWSNSKASTPNTMSAMSSSKPSRSTGGRYPTGRVACGSASTWKECNS